jgi:hypothetical protein
MLFHFLLLLHLKMIFFLILRLFICFVSYFLGCVARPSISSEGNYFMRRCPEVSTCLWPFYIFVYKFPVIFQFSFYSFNIFAGLKTPGNGSHDGSHAILSCVRELFLILRKYPSQYYFHSYFVPEVPLSLSCQNFLHVFCSSS